MKSLKDILAEALINKKVSNTEKREVWDCRIYIAPSLRLIDFNDFKTCYDLTKASENDFDKSDINEIKKAFDTNKIVIVTPLSWGGTPLSWGGLSCNILDTEYDLKSTMKFMCTIDINDFNYENLDKLRNKYNLN